MPATDPPATPSSSPASVRAAWIALLVVGAAWHTAYVLAQAAHDPVFDTPMMDGAIYVDWAKRLVAGGGAPPGAFYHAPLYPYVLALFFKVFGESYTTLYLMQHGLLVGLAAAIGRYAPVGIGQWGSLAAAALLLIYQPLMFFASAPLAETLAITLLVGATLLIARPGSLAAGAGGAALGLAIVARPNLLLVALAWATGELWARRWRRLGLLLGLVACCLGPITLRNYLVSGHWVPVSSNSGLTAYHGNGPGARGLYTPPAGFSGGPLLQREQATRLARERSGRNLDPVDADRWWGREALRTRARDPGETLVLLVRRLALLVDSHEYGLDYPPELDGNPWRPAFRWGRLSLPWLPLALILVLAAAAVVLGGWRDSGGWVVWSAILATALTPLLFYVSSRYRLPMVALLSLPAGAGLVRIVTAPRGVPLHRWACLFALCLLVLSPGVLVPTLDVRRSQRAGELMNRAVAYKSKGDLDRAGADARTALELDAHSASLWFNYGVIAAARGDASEAERAYRTALTLEPRLTPAAGNLAVLLGRAGRFAEAVALLRDTLRLAPHDRDCWNNLVVSLWSRGDVEGALEAAERARAMGIDLDRAMLAALHEAATKNDVEVP